MHLGKVETTKKFDAPKNMKYRKKIDNNNLYWSTKKFVCVYECIQKNCIEKSNTLTGNARKFSLNPSYSSDLPLSEYHLFGSLLKSLHGENLTPKHDFQN